MKTILLTLCLICCSSLFAQITLTMNDAPVAGDAISLRSGTYLDLDNVGVDQLWDYSSVGGGGITNITFIDIAVDPNEDDFPDADVVMVAGVTRGYIKVDAEGFHQLGQQYSTVFTYLNDPITSIKYPNTFGTQWVDTWSGYTTNGYLVSGEVHATTNGYGTLRLPWGDVDNVLRIQAIDTTLQLGSTPSDQFIVIDTTILYYKNGYPNYLLRALNRYVINLGAGTSQTYLHFATEESVVGISESWVSGIGMDLFPNPAMDQVTMTATMMANGTLEVIDPLGRNMIADRVTSGPGIISHLIDVRSWPSGIYIARIVDDVGNKGVKRFVVQ